MQAPHWENIYPEMPSYSQELILILDEDSHGKDFLMEEKLQPATPQESG